MSTPQISVAQSERFCAPDADITISSSDGVLFKLHRKNLELHSDIFADAANATLPGNDSDITELPERADVLDLLFQYMYRQPQPDLRMVDFDLCARLAEAAEKYLVYSAAPVTKLRLRDSVAEHPLEVLDYAGRHNHNELATEAARLSMGLPVAQAARTLAPEVLTKWAVFYDQWHAQSRRIVVDHGVYSKISFRYGLDACVASVNATHNEREHLERMTPDKNRLVEALQEMLDIEYGVSPEEIQRKRDKKHRYS